MNENYLLIPIAILIACLALTVTGGQQEYTSIMNASIQQPICVQLSGNYSAGIFFTNTTTIGVQYPITNMLVLNNATGNYWGASGGTVYSAQACSGNTINIKIAHCACDNLKCSSGDCAKDVDMLYVNYTTDGGVGWANGTTATFATHSPPNSNYYFPDIDTYQLIAGNLAPGSYIYMRYWIDPRPNNAPSGVYNNTFKIRAVEISQSFGTCNC
ncbi:MAG: hypothetical protein QXO84_01860 [Candidatus Aenigmatarchaeota archaeon]